MSKVKNENFVAIQGWMVTELGLKGNSLLIYAIIYGFSQAEGQVFNGSLQYLADWTNSSKQSVINCLKKLVDDGLLGKNEKNINGVKFVEYYSKKFNGVLNKVEWGIKQSLTNNINNNINNNISKKDKVELTYNELVENFTDNKELQKTLLEFIKMRKLIKKPLTNMALTRILNKLNKLTKDTNEQIAILEQSIVKDWQDIYELKDKTILKDIQKTNEKVMHWSQDDLLYTEDYDKLLRKETTVQELIKQGRLIPHYE